MVEEMGHSQSRNTNTSIFYVHRYEKEETETNRDTAGNGSTNQSCAFLKSCPVGRQSHPLQRPFCKVRSEATPLGSLRVEGTLPALAKARPLARLALSCICTAQSFTNECSHMS
jgi:hypothetical protein